MALGYARRPLQWHCLPLSRWAFVAVGRGNDGAGHDVLVVVLRAGRRWPCVLQHASLPVVPEAEACPSRRSRADVARPADFATKSAERVEIPGATRSTASIGGGLSAFERLEWLWLAVPRALPH
jgi:hypothetical protein